MPLSVFGGYLLSHKGTDVTHFFPEPRVKNLLDHRCAGDWPIKLPLDSDATQRYY